MESKRITSSENTLIKNVIKLKKKNDDNFLIVEGKRSVEMFLNSKLYENENIFLTESFKEKEEDFIKNIRNLNFVKSNIMKNISSMVTPPGILGVFKKKYFNNEIYFEKFGSYVLYKISDPGNLGTIIRTAVALNRKFLITIDGCHYHNQKVVQSSAGMLANIKIYRLSLNDFISYKVKNSILTFALDAKGENLFSQSNFSEKIFLVVGNEANGIPEENRKLFSNFFSLPMSKDCESLNASVAAAVAGYKIWGSM